MPPLLQLFEPHVVIFIRLDAQANQNTLGFFRKRRGVLKGTGARKSRFTEDEAGEEENGRIEPVGRADSCVDHTPVRSLE
ncbi:hypothetical protein EYF80_058934 [Liparis tanakae]|uniref:Uncharacterized protein n=1 Tax=Liparis tanakae TaxID=230148 RepID=A0A4Z2EQ46_9TELE|nr:hypothetical protein EYF80_058934 [Liparis tanakae]